MSADSYELLALAMRYWFSGLGVLIVLRFAGRFFRERGERLRALRSLPDAGFVGEIVDLSNGRSYPLAEEGVIGSGRHCDIRIKRMLKRQLEFAFVRGKGLRLRSCSRRIPLHLEGQPYGPWGYALHGTRIATGRQRLLVRLFTGTDAPVPGQSADSETLSGDEARRLWGEAQDISPAVFSAPWQRDISDQAAPGVEWELPDGFTPGVSGLGFPAEEAGPETGVREQHKFREEETEPRHGP